ncbi:MAG: GNAT family protein [Terrisporobacter sp.]
MDSILCYNILDCIYPQMKIIESKRFIFRPIDIDDVYDIYEYLSQEQVVKYLPFKVHKNISDTKKFVQSYFINNYKKGKVGNYAIYYKADKKVIGNVGLNNVNPNSNIGEIGICINPKYWGNNFSTELCIVSLITGFEILNLDKIVVKTYEKNKYTSKVLNNLKFEFVESFKYRGNQEECNLYELRKEEYFKMKKSYLPSLIRKYR